MHELRLRLRGGKKRAEYKESKKDRVKWNKNICLITLLNVIIAIIINQLTYHVNYQIGPSNNYCVSCPT
jgi:hypothetical protein